MSRPSIHSPRVRNRRSTCLRDAREPAPEDGRSAILPHSLTPERWEDPASGVDNYGEERRKRLTYTDSRTDPDNKNTIVENIGEEDSSGEMLRRSLLYGQLCKYSHDLPGASPVTVHGSFADFGAAGNTGVWPRIVAS